MRAILALTLAISPAPVLAGEAELDGMIRSEAGRVEQWASPPSLLVVTPILRYDPAGRAAFEATGDHLSQVEVDALVEELTAALTLLSGGRFDRFAEVHVESAPAGARVRTVRTGHIVVARFDGLRASSRNIGFGGRSVAASGAIRAGTVMLDAEYDARGTKRHLLRAHELGHALGFNHVDGRASIMNPQIGPEPTEADRLAALESARRALSLWPRSEF